MPGPKGFSRAGIFGEEKVFQSGEEDSILDPHDKYFIVVNYLVISLKDMECSTYTFNYMVVSLFPFLYVIKQKRAKSFHSDFSLQSPHIKLLLSK